MTKTAAPVAFARRPSDIPIRPDERPLIWVTRVRPGATATAARLTLAGFEPLVAPVLTFRSLAVAPETSLNPGEALAFTSIQGVRRAASLFQARDVVVFAVGDATAAAARSAGFSKVVTAGGDVAALVALISSVRPQGGVVHPGALETAGDLVGSLNALGVRSRKLAVYRTQSASRLPDTVRDVLAKKALAAIVIHSPKAGRTAADLLARAEASLEEIVALGLSEACLAPLRATGLKDLVPAEAPTEDALMTVLATAFGAGA